MDTQQSAYDEVYVYAMGFILQRVVDAYTVQTATAESKRIAVVFGWLSDYVLSDN